MHHSNSHSHSNNNPVVANHDTQNRTTTTAISPSDPDTPPHDLPTTIHTSTPNEGVNPTAFAGKYIAIDCEMVGFGPTPSRDSQVARVSLVNYHGTQLYDTYVTPQAPVTDYRTAVSGITAAHMRSGRPFREVQSHVITFLQNRVLVGHHLKADLEVMRIKHPRNMTRDTSRCPSYRELCARGGNPRLRDLAERVLGVEIQRGEHDSVVDARVAMMLYRARKEEMDNCTWRFQTGFGRRLDGKKKGVDRAGGLVPRALCAPAGDEGDVAAAAGQGKKAATNKKKKKKKKKRK